MKRFLTGSVMLLLLGCGSPNAPDPDAAEIAEQERQFRQGIPEVTTLTGGETSRDALARRYLVAIAQRDTVALASLAVTQAEFAWLVYPHHLYRQPPYAIAPATMWQQIRAGSAEGLARVLDQFGGRSLQFRDIDCQRDRLQLESGTMKLWGECALTFQAADSTLTRQLFWSMVELDGVIKFLNYKNRLITIP